MVTYCCVPGCKNDYKKAPMYRIPRGKHQRACFIRAINRKDDFDKDAARICAEHFVGGTISKDPDDENYRPTLFNKNNKTGIKRHNTEPTPREGRKYRREVAQVFEEAAATQTATMVAAHARSLNFHSGYAQQNTEEGAEETIPASVFTTQPSIAPYLPDDVSTPGYVVETNEVGCQTDKDPLLKENEDLKRDIASLRAELKKFKWSVDKISHDDKKTKFYTGLPSFAVFMWLLNYLAPRAENMIYWDGKKTLSERKHKRKMSLSLGDQLLAVLMRLKLGLFGQDCANRFAISTGTFSKIFTTWICLLQKELSLLNKFPSAAKVKEFTPSQFQKYPNLRIIIDCTEIFTQKPSSLVSQNLLFSNYKHHNTLKFLVGITPSGVISFVSDAWGGRVSDRHITEHCGLLDLLEPGDNVMADKGFTISDLLIQRKITLNIPPFLKSSKQFTPAQVIETRQIAELRIHVERSIGRVKNFHILKRVLGLNLAPIAGQIFKTCAYLSNFDVPMVTERKNFS